MSTQYDYRKLPILRESYHQTIDMKWKFSWLANTTTAAPPNTACHHGR